MATRPRALIAAQPEAGAVLQRLLNDVVDVLIVDTAADAHRVLEREGPSIDVILSTFAFDESRMIEFLMELKRNAATSNIPFIAVRVFRQRYSDALVEQWGAIAMQCGAAAFLDIARLEQDAAKKTLSDAVTPCAPGQGS